MFHTQGNTQVYSPFGSYVVEQHDVVCLNRYIEDIPRPGLKQGGDPSFAHDPEQRQAA